MLHERREARDKEGRGWHARTGRFESVGDSQGGSSKGWPCPRTTRCSSSSGHRRTTEGCRRRAPELGTRHATIRSSTAPCFRTSSAASLGFEGRMPCVVAHSSRCPSIPSSGSLLCLHQPPCSLAATLATPSPRHSSRSPPFRTRCPLVLADESLLSREPRVGCGQETERAESNHRSF